jgi:hypothetical protein
VIRPECGFLPSSADRAQHDRTEPVVHDQFNVPLEDAELLGEVQLLTDLIIAATDAAGPLEELAIDRLLGHAT